MTSAFFNIFIAQKEPVVLCVQKRTRPKEPVPRVTPTSKSSSERGVGRVLTAIMLMNQNTSAEELGEKVSAEQTTALTGKR